MSFVGKETLFITYANSCIANKELAECIENVPFSIANTLKALYRLNDEHLHHSNKVRDIEKAIWFIRFRQGCVSGEEATNLVVVLDKLLRLKSITRVANV